MPDERLESHVENSNSENGIRFVDDISEGERSDHPEEMDVEGGVFVPDDDDVLVEDDEDDEGDEEDEEDDIDDHLDDDGNIYHEDEFDGLYDSINEQEHDHDEEDEEDDFDHPALDDFLSTAGARPLSEALGRLRRLVPPMEDPEEWGDDADDSNIDDEIGGGTHIGIPFLDTLRSALVTPHMMSIIRQLRSQNDSDVLTALGEISVLLLMPHGGGFGSSALIPVEALSMALVELLRSSANIDVQIMTARAMSQLIDSGVGSGATKALIRAGIVPVMRRIFSNVSYIDLIEQLIHVVNPVASTEPRLVLESDCLMPCVGTLDFFNEYIQREIMAAVDASTKEITVENSMHAKQLLGMFPLQPNENVIGSYSSLIIAIAKLNEDDFKEIVTFDVWNNLVQYVQPGTLHIARIMRAVAHTITRCPSYVQSIDTLAERVSETLIQSQTEDKSALFSKLMSVSKDILFAGLKLLQVLLPLPGTIGQFNGPYRKDTNKSTLNAEKKDIINYASMAVPLAIAAYSASTNTPVRQLSILVVMQVVALLKNDEEFVRLARELGLVQFTAQVISEGTDHLALAIGGLDLAWDMVSNKEILHDLSNSGISGDLEQYISGDTAEPKGQFAPTDDIRPVASFMASQLLEKVESAQESSNDDIEKLVQSVRDGDYRVEDLLRAPLPHLIRAGLLEALSAGSIVNHLNDGMVSLLQQAVTRLERFDLQLTGSRAKSIEEVLSRSVYLRLSELDGTSPDRSWAVSVSAFATVRSLEDFIRSRLQAQSFFASSRLANPENRRNNHNNFNETRFQFWAGDHRLPHDVSILKAIQGQHGVPVLKYERIDEKDEEEEATHNEKNDTNIKGPIALALNLLRDLAQENERRHEIVSWDKFRSTKITAKLTRQLADVLAIAASMLPQWTFDTVHEYPFLYPLTVRLHFVQLTSFGMGRNLRLLRRMQQESDTNDDDILPEEDESNQILGRHKHQKFRLSRDSILEGALRLLDISSKNPAVVEVMFYGEEGTGKGPTQEFFALASQALSDLSLGMWRNTPAGLYPAPSLFTSPIVLRNFKGVGMLVARALLDKRILDFHLSPAFFDAVLSDSGPSIEKLRQVDPELALSLEKLLKASPKEMEEIGLDFSLPGTDLELLPSGKDIEVTTENVRDYVHLICDYIVGSGIKKQIEMFRLGFSDIIPVSALRSFMLDELATLCGADRGEDWTVATLRDAFTAGHGYNMASKPVEHLINILSTLSKSERRKFLMFATGSPRLPVGGFKALTPPFTVVVKYPDDEKLEADQYLPSVMTCANYFKLPAYSNEAVMRRQLKIAMTEGSDAFLLS